MKYNKENPLRLATLCSGYESQGLAMRRLKELYPEFDFKLVAWAEYDPETPNVPLERQPAVIAHNALFTECADLNFGDMTKIDWEKFPDCDMLFYSTPCQSVSQAGLQHGFEEGSGTRSSIIWNVRDCVKAKRPKFLMLENVRAMVSSKFVGLFNLWQRELENLGYVNFAQVLNAKDFNVPQNRERIFLISIRIDDDEDYPKYFFPKPIPLKVCLADVLEEEVEDRYFLSDEMLARFCEKSLEEENAPARNRSDECDGDDCEDEDDFENFFVAQ